MKKLSFIIYILFLFLQTQLNFAQQNNVKDKELIGKWKSIKIDQKNVEINIQFNLDSTVKYEISTLLNGVYTLRNNKLVSYFTKFGTKNTVVDTSIIVIKDNTLTQKSLVGGTTIKMKRIDNTNVNSNLIIGKWKSDNYNGYQAITEFSPYFQVNVRLLVKSIEGEYSVDKNMITIFSPNSYRMRMNYKITGNTMTLHNLENGKDLTMVKLKN